MLWTKRFDEKDKFSAWGYLTFSITQRVLSAKKFWISPSESAQDPQIGGESTQRITATDLFDMPCK
jgi:hypothetical protein